MRIQLARILFTGVFFLGVGFSYWKTEEKAQENLTRVPASIENKKILTPKKETFNENGAVTVYQYEREVHAKVKAKQHADSKVNLNLKGKVWMREMPSAEGFHTYSLQYELTLEGSPEVHRSSLPFLLDLTPEYKIKGIRTVQANQKTEEDELNILKDFSTFFAYRSDSDTVGHYTYRFDADKNKFTKLKTQYDEVKDKNIQIVSSKQEGLIDPSTHEVMKTWGSEQTRVGDGSSSIEMVSRFLIGKGEAAPVPVKVKVTEEREVIPQDLHLQSHADIRLKSWPLLQASLAQIGTMPKGERLELFHDLTKLLKADPSKIADFKKYIEAAQKEPGRLTFGIGVLATAGSEAAQKALTEWYQTLGAAKSDSNVEHTILNALSTADAMLTDETRKFLRDLTDASKGSADIAENAAFALGASLKKSNDEESRTRLLELLTSAKTEAQRASVIDAIGNSGDAHFLSTIQNIYANGTPLEREKAVFAARFMKSESASGLLLQGFQDAASNVRQASIRAVGFQESIQPYASALRSCASNGNQECQSILNRTQN